MAVQQPQTLGSLLKRHRLAAGLTQEELAERAAVSVHSISDLERGVQRRPHPHTIRQLADGLGLKREERAQFEATVQAGRERWPPIEHPFSSTPRLLTIVERHNNLPVQPTPFIGRTDDVQTLAGLLARDDVRLLTLTGPGGIGKTRLAIEAGAAVEQAFEAGVYFVSLASLTDPARVLPTVAQTLGLEEVGDRSLHAALLEFLRHRNLLLVLDTFEHLPGAALSLGDLLAVCPQVTICVTSRTPLHLAGEQEYAVSPLDVPSTSLITDLEALSRYDAVVLFLSRAQRIHPALRLSTHNAPQVVEICRRLDGLPLAIELAAARLRFFSLREVVDGLSRPLQLLADGPRDAPMRQQTLRAAIDWSYALLDEQGQALFRRLAVFTGGCTLEAVRAVCVEDPAAAIEHMASLLDHGLVRRTEGQGGDSRFVMLDTIHEYAGERLEANEEADAARQRHADYYACLARQTEAAFLAEEPEGWIWLLENDQHNLRTALGRLFARGEIDRFLQLAIALTRFWCTRGYLMEGREWIEAGLAGDGSTEPLTRAWALLSLGQIAAWQRDEKTVTESVVASLTLFRRAGDRRGAAYAMMELGNLYSNALDSDAGRPLLEESVALFREINDGRGLSRSLRWLGNDYSTRGDWERASSLLMESELLARELRILDELAMNLSDRAVYSIAQGHFEEAEAPLREAVPLLLAHGETSEALDSLEMLACAVGCQGEGIAAATLLAAVDTVRQQIGCPLVPGLAAHRDRCREVARSTVGDEQWEAAWARGQSLPLEIAISEVVGIPGGAVP